MSIEFTFAPEITDDVILKAFEGTNFGRTDYREFLGYSVLQKACGWHCGWTITNIMVELKLITPEHHRVTKLGRMFLTDCYKEPGQKQPSPQPTTDTYQQIENDGWIEWGGEMAIPPLANEVMVEVRLRSGTCMKDRAKTFRWRNHINHFGDIIAYRQIENDGREG